MLSVRIHLDHIGIFAADRVFISKLQGAPVPQIKDMGYQRMSVCLYDPVRRVRGRVIHDQNIRNLRDLRAFQLLQHPLYIFLLIVCRNDNQQFFLCFFSTIVSSLFFLGKQLLQQPFLVLVIYRTL